MKINLHKSYQAAISISLALQVPLLLLMAVLIPTLFHFLLIPTAAYVVITSVVIYLRPQPTPRNIRMVGPTGYASWLAVAGAVVAVLAICGD